MPNSFHWWQKIFGSTSEYNNATNCIFEKSSSKCSFFYVGTVFTNMLSCFSESSFCGSKSENKIHFFWKENFSAECSPAHKECNFNNAAKKLDKNSETFRSIFENNYINKQFSQKTISWENVSSHIDCLPGSLAEKTSPGIWKVSCWKKKWEKDSLLRQFIPQKVPPET